MKWKKDARLAAGLAFSIIGTLSGITSLTKLFTLVLDLKIGTILSIAFAFYDSIVELFTPILRPAVHFIYGRALDVFPHLPPPHPEWPHLFILTVIYFALDARVSLRVRKKTPGAAAMVTRRKTPQAVNSLVSGILFSCVFSALSGMAFSKELWRYGAFLAIFFSSFFIHACIAIAITSTRTFRPDGQTWLGAATYYTKSELSPLVKNTLVATLIGIVVLAVTESPIVFIPVFLFITMRGFSWLRRGMSLARADARKEVSFIGRFYEYNSGYFATWFFATLLGALFAISVNAFTTVPT